MKLRKKTKRILIIGIVVLVLIGILYSSGVFKNNLNTLSTVPSSLESDLGKCTGGWTTMSADVVSINGVDKIRVYGSASGSECMQIQFTKDQLNSKLPNGYEATKDITIGNVRLLSYTETYPIDRTGNSFPSLQIATYGDGLDTCRLNVADPLACCKKHGVDSIASPFYTGTAGYYTNCIYLGSNGLEAGFDASRSYGDYDVLFDFSGDQYHLSRGQQSVNSNNGKIHIEWRGNLQNIDGVYPPGYDARLIFSNYDLVQDGAYSLTQNQVTNFISCYNQNDLSNGGALTQTRYNYCKSKFDGNTAQILSSKLEKYKSDGSALIYDAETDANNLYVSLKATPFPSFIIDLDASYFGILALEGKPEITSCIPSQDDLISGKNKVVSFSVKNNANTNNVQFYGGLTCTNGLQGFFTNTYFNANQEKSINVELHPSNPNSNQPNLPVSCTVKINDLKSGDYDTCLFSGSVAYDSGIVCTPNSLSCDNQFKNVMKCTSDGKNMVIHQECDNGCELYGNGARCRSNCPTGQTLCKDNVCRVDCGNVGDCKSCAEWITNYIKQPKDKCNPTNIIETKWYNPLTYINFTGYTKQNLLCPILWSIVLIVFIFSVLFLNDFLEDKFRSLRGKKKVWGRLLLSSGIALLVAWITYLIFFLGLILFIIIILLKTAIRRYIPRI